MAHTHRRRKITPAARWAIVASCLCHAALLGLIVAAVIYLPHRLAPPSGSAAGAPTLVLQKMIIVADPEPPAPPTPTPPTPDLPSPTPEIKTTMQEATAISKVPDLGVPVLTAHSTQTAKKEHHDAVAHTAPHPSAAPATSSFAPGQNVLPHPPYPTDAKNHGQTGTVVVNVMFDAAGNVARVSVATPSGVKSLDNATCSYIQEHWHSAEFAGHTIFQPVEYSLQ